MNNITAIQLNTIFPITQENVGSFCVDLRKLHGWLGVGSDFRKWIQRRLEEYEFSEDLDYRSFLTAGNRGGSQAKDYLATIDMAKDLAMVERNDKGKEVRKYFIEVERRFKAQQAPQPLPQGSARWTDAEATMRSAMALADITNMPKHIVITETGKEIYNSIGLDLRHMLAHSAYMDDVKDDEKMLKPKELGKIHGISGAKMNKLLEVFELQYKDGSTWKPTEKGKQYCSVHAWVNNGKSGYNLKWNVEAVNKLFRESLN